MISCRIEYELPYVFEAKTRKFEIAGGGSQFTVAHARTDENLNTQSLARDEQRRKVRGLHVRVGIEEYVSQ